MKNNQNQLANTDILQNLIEETIAGSLTSVMERMFNQMMFLQREQFLEASPYQRTDDRIGYANGFKPLTVKSGEGKMQLQAPQVRNCQQKFRPSVLECLSRSEKAFRSVLGEMYIKGVSTRKVGKVIESIWPSGVSSGTISNITKELESDLENFRNRKLEKPYQFIWLDAQYEKVRQDGILQSFAVFVAIGVDYKGVREVIGVSGQVSEAEIHWRDFMDSLNLRGLKGVQMIISDAHAGLREAREAIFPATPWQRCFFHLQQNAQSKITNVSQRKEIANDLKNVFSQFSLEDAKSLLKKYVIKWESKSKKLSEWMEEACLESFTYFKFDEKYWKKIRTSNPLERLNREIKRRTRVVSIFPSESSCIRLISAILIENNDNWAGKAYIKNSNQ